MPLQRDKSRRGKSISKMLCICGLLLGLAISGCAAHHQASAPVVNQAIISGDSAPPAAEAPANPMQTSNGVMTPITYRLQMPYGANSLDDSFWKLVDEDIVDVPTGDRLSRNGIRVGRARVADWSKFLSVLTNESAITLSVSHTTSLWGYGDAPFNMSDIMPEETLYIYDEHGLSMRSYDDCINIFSISFAWAPRKYRTMRVTICPVVHSTRTRMDYSLSDNPLPARIQEMDHLYDLNLCSDVAPGDFLIVGTSTATQDPNRMGSLFLTRDGPNQRFEEVLIIVGETVRAPGKNRHAAGPTTRSVYAR